MEFNHDVYILRGMEPFTGMWGCGHPLKANKVSLPQQLGITNRGVVVLMQDLCQVWVCTCGTNVTE